ncbi:hypothetical protein ACJIZ3_024729 [Penstemon smallii]|uniref:Uncharacterized protein n=1 Tax=Penstemon smallii TaxID=265156 RepID=A0ABD3TVZ1_9LAMI
MRHCRSNSFPSTSHPVMDDVENQLCRLNSSDATSTSATSICSNLASLRDLHENINNMIQLPSIQQALYNEQGESWMNELLDGSLSLVDFCGFSRDILCLTKESVQDLESSIRRNRGEDMNAYMTSRKIIIKKVNKCIKNLKSFNQNSTSVLLHKDDDLKAIAIMLQATEALDLSILKSVLALVSGEKKQSKQGSWSLLSNFTSASRVHSEIEQEEDLSLNINKSRTMQSTLKQLKASEMKIQEIEEELEIFFRMMSDVEDQLCRLKSSEATSTSANSICANLASLRDLHENINNLIQMPSIQQALSNEQGERWINELLEGSLSLVDLCEFSRDIVCLTKESVQDLESSIRRNGGEDLNAYVASRKMIVKKLKASEMTIQEIELGLETFFRSLVKTRVTLLNLLEGSLGLVDLCGFSRDIVCLTKESVQDLESSIRRNRGEDMNAYVASRKMIIKKVNKCIKNLKSFNQNSTSLLHKDADLKAIATMLKETEALDLSILKSVLTLVSGEKKQSKQRSWSLFSKSSRVNSEVEQESGSKDFSLNIDKSRTMQNTLKQLKDTETTIHKIELELEIFFRSLVKTRVTLLNVLSI